MSRHEQFLKQPVVWLPKQGRSCPRGCKRGSAKQPHQNILWLIEPDKVCWMNQQTEL